MTTSPDPNHTTRECVPSASQSASQEGRSAPASRVRPSVPLPSGGTHSASTVRPTPSSASPDRDTLALFHPPGTCPEDTHCHYGGPGNPPICNTHCGLQHGPIWKQIPDTLNWAERNHLFEERRYNELTPVLARMDGVR